MDNEEKILTILEKMNEKVDSNEDKILSILSEIQTEQKQTNHRLVKLEQGQAKLEQDMNGKISELLSAIGDVIRNEMKEVNESLSNVENSVVIIENEHGRILGELRDGYLLQQEKQVKYAQLEKRVETLEIDMSAVRMTLKKKPKKTAGSI